VEAIMFTQSHYVKIADVIRSARTSHQGTDVLIKQLAINELTLKLCEMFKRDNPKFNQLIFIEACNGDLLG
jgi:hypothetical protein